MQDEYVIQPSSLPGAKFFIEDEADNEEEAVRVYLDGVDGGPNAVVCRHSHGARGERHFHHGPQFQFTLDGTVEYPRQTVEKLGVFYTDHNTLYGPFMMNNNHRMLVCFPRPSGQMWATDKRVGAARNRDGRQMVRSAADVAWEPVVGQVGLEHKVLIDESEGPSAQIVRCAPGSELNLGSTTYGRFEFILEGSAFYDGRELETESLRFVRGTDEVKNLTAGPNGATVIVLTYDDDATKGELGGLSMYDRMATFTEIEQTDLQKLQV